MVVRNRNGVIRPYAKRQIPAEVPVKSEYVPRFVSFRFVSFGLVLIIGILCRNGVIRPYAKRQIPAEVPVKSE